MRLAFALVPHKTALPAAHTRSPRRIAHNREAKAPAWQGLLVCISSLTMSYFHTGIRTIIGAESFHCPVRDGKEWDQLAMVIRLKLFTAPGFSAPGAVHSQSRFQFLIASLQRAAATCVALKPIGSRSHSSLRWPRHCCLRADHQSYRVKPHGQLVLVSLTHYCASTPNLSTSWSTTTLQGAQGPGKTHLETSFPLRCFQRLSLPHLATRRCHWRDNRYTRGASTPVLSY